MVRQTQIKIITCHAGCLDKHQLLVAFNEGNLYDALLGLEKRPRVFKNLLSKLFGNANHLWMWDNKLLINELKSIGFRGLRVCCYNNSGNHMFKYVEDHHRFIHSVAINCIN